MTMNSPDSLAELFHAASPDHDAVATAELMREVGLKCIGFNGVCLSSFPTSALLPFILANSLSITGSSYHKHAQRLPRLPPFRHRILPLHNTHPYPLTHKHNRNVFPRRSALEINLRPF